jgi:xanthine/uracil permease
MGILVYWMLLFLTLLIAAKTIGLADAEVLIGDVLAFIPKVVLAVVILIVGLSFAGFVADIVQTGAVNAQVREARLLSNLSRWAIVILVAIMALNQVDIDTEFMSQAFLVLFGAICLALALAFGLGCRDLAGKIANDWWAREQAESKALADANKSTDASTDA